MEHMIVIGEAEVFTVRAPDVNMAAPAQCAWCPGRGNGHGIKVMGNTLFNDDATAVVKIIPPAGVGVFRAMNKNVAFGQPGVNGNNPHMGPLPGPVNHLGFTAFNMDPLNGLAGK